MGELRGFDICNWESGVACWYENGGIVWSIMSSIAKALSYGETEPDL